MPKRALLVCVAAVAAFGLPRLPASAGPAAAQPAPSPAAAPAAAATSAPAGTYQSCPAPKAAGQMQCQSVVRASAVKPMGVQPAAAPDGYGPADLRSAYVLPSDTAGDGQTVAIVDAYDAPNAEADLGVYRAQYGLPPCTSDNGCFTRVDQRGGTQWPAYDAGWAGEVALDLEMVGAVCPKCHLLLVEADTASDSDLFAAEDRAIDLGARFVSNSWAGNETPDQMQVADPHFDHPGVAITASSGDSGFPGGYPAASQYVTAVGGTSLVRDAGTSRGWSETAWQRAGSTCSPWEPAPSFQTQDMTDCTKRAASDVSAVADPATGVAVYDRGWQVYGGTSVSAPIVAATYALAGAPLTGSRPNALPYQHPEALNDVTSGNNGCTFKFCQAGPGWDGPTGLGTPNGTAAFSAGAHGELVGTVTDGLAAPIADATVTAGGQQVTSGADGRFAFTLPPGHYDVVTSKFGYQSATRSVDLADGQTLTANVRLLLLPQQTVSGTVRDGSGHGWPLYATVQVHGQPATRVFTNPRTGAYQLHLPRDAAYDLDVAPVYQGYEQATTSVTLGRTPVVADVADPVAFASCDAAGYQYTTTPVSTETFDNPTTPAGWSLVDSLGRGLLWSFDDPGARGNLTGGSGGFAIVDSDHANPSQFQDTSLVSPTWDLSGLTHPALSFHTDYFGMSNERATVELSVNGGATWTQLWIHQTDSVRGPNLQTIDLSRWAGQPSVQVRFRYQSYATWWWQVDDVSLGERSCSPTPGGLVLGEVTDKNTGTGLTGASVTSGALATSTVATPDDAAVGEGFYWTFAKPGSYALHATQPGGYQPVATTVPVADNTVTSADFALPAGRIAITPADLTASVDLGGHRTQTVKVSNTGSAPATVALNDVPGGVAAPASRGPATQRVSGTYLPGPASRTLSARAATTDAVPQAAPWVTAADFPIPIADNAMASADGKVYSAGGTSSNGAPLPRLYRYDPDAASWTRLADMQVTRDYPAAAFLDGKLYVAGGWDGSDTGITATTEVYDPATDTWSAGPDLPTAVAAASVAVLDNRMYVIGGCTGLNECGTASVQVYDPALDRWEAAASYPQPVSFEGCGAIAGKLYCAGGTGDQTGATRNGYVYDPGTDTWSPIAGLPDGDQWAAASTAADGKLLLVGGVIDGSSLITNQGWAYDPGANSWSQLPNANTIAWRAAGACGFYKVGGAGLVPALSNAEMLPGYGDCATAGTVSWLSVKPAQATTLAPGATMTATVSLDTSRGIDQPGTYYAALSLSEDTPYPFSSIPVTMTVNPPSSWGKLAGTVTGVTCAGATIALGGATISVTGTTQTFTLKTDAAGSYQLWLDAANSPLSLVVGKNGWAPTGRSKVKLVKGKTTTVNFTLQPSPACH